MAALHWLTPGVELISQLTWGIVFAVLSVTVYASGMVLEKAAERAVFLPSTRDKVCI